MDIATRPFLPRHVYRCALTLSHSQTPLPSSPPHHLAPHYSSHHNLSSVSLMKTHTPLPHTHTSLFHISATTPQKQREDKESLEVERMLQEDSERTVESFDESLRDPAGSSHLMGDAGDLELSESSRV